MIGEIGTAPEATATADVDFSAMVDFLEERGYLKVNKEIGQLLSPDAITKSIKELQDFVGLPADGIMNKETAEWMKKDRCGRPDKERPLERKRRRRRYVAQGSEWRKRLLTWQLERRIKQQLTMTVYPTTTCDACSKTLCRNGVTSLRSISKSSATSQITRLISGCPSEH